MKMLFLFLYFMWAAVPDQHRAVAICRPIAICSANNTKRMERKHKTKLAREVQSGT